MEISCPDNLNYLFVFFLFSSLTVARMRNFSEYFLFTLLSFQKSKARTEEETWIRPQYAIGRAHLGKIYEEK